MTYSQNKTSELFQWKELQSFQHMDLHENLIRGIYSVGFEKPALIQKKAIPPMVAGLDLIAQSEAGSGKTAAYVLGLLSNISDKSTQIQGIVVVPVRQLALAVCKFIDSVSEYTNFRVQSCVGGVPMREEKYKINKEKRQIIVGTPGRILDHIEKGSIKTDDVKVVVLDQADELLSKVFVEQIIQLFKNVPKEAQSCLFSATYLPQTFEITKNFMKDPYMLTLNPNQVPVGGIKQFHVALENDSQKLPTLLNICKKLLIHHWIIFTRTNEKANEVAKELAKLGVPVTVIHSEIEDRNASLNEFKSGKTRILICTDVMARGIDIPSVSLVINFDMPHPRAAMTQYLHRIGRCGRFGKAGVSISFTLQEDGDILFKLKKIYKVQIQDLPTDPKLIAPWLATD